MSYMRERLTYGNVVATLALFVALGGTSYALAALPRNSVGSEQIRPGAVSKSDLRKAQWRRGRSATALSLSGISRAALAAPLLDRRANGAQTAWLIALS
jgi:hypothetical protein